MKTVIVPGLDIKIPPGSAFKIETPPMLPKMHLLAAVVAPRGYGKGVITTNLIEHLKVVDRLILVSPSASSNKALNDRLKSILAPEDIFTNPNDITVLDRIVDIVEKERDDYEEYWDKKKKYDLLMKKLESDTPLFQIPSDVLMASFDGGRGPGLGGPATYRFLRYTVASRCDHGCKQMHFGHHWRCLNLKGRTWWYLDVQPWNLDTFHIFFSLHSDKNDERGYTR